MAVAYDPYEDEDYYTLSNPLLAGELFAPYSEGAVAFSEPSAGGVRYPVALPASGGQVGSLGAVTPQWQRAVDEIIEQNRPAQQRQYNMEVDRAVRNKVEEMNPANAQDAIRLRGLLKFQNLTRDGMDSAEAIRQVAPELYFNHPQATALAMREVPSMDMPNITTIPFGDNEALFVDNKYRTTLRNPPKKDAMRDLELKEAGEEVTQAMRDLNTLLKSPFATPEQISEARRNVASTRSNRRNLVRGVQTPSIQATNDDMVPVISPSGQRGRVPRSKLDAAKKAGYKVQ